MTILCVNREVGIELQCMLQHTARCINTLCAVHCEVLTYCNSSVEELIVGIGTTRDAFEEAVLDGALVVVVAQREERIALVGTVAHREVVLLYHTCTGDFIEPVCITGTHAGVLVEIHIHRHTVEHRIACLVIAPVIVVTKVVVVGVETIVHTCLPESPAPLAGIHRLDLVGVERGGHTTVKVHLDFAVLTSLGCDYYHTVGSTATIDRSRGCILQHLYRLDIIAIQLVHAGFSGHTVDDVERVVVVESADTADAHCCSTGGITIGSDVHARHTALKGLHRVVLVLLRHLIYTHCRYGTSQVGFSLRGIASHHHLLQHFRIFLQGHCHPRLGRHFLCLIADVRNDKNGTVINLEFEVSVNVGNSAVGSSFLLHCGTNDALTCRVHHSAMDFCLRIHHSTREKEHCA